MITRAKISGMSCQHCVRAVFTALNAVPGIHRANVGIGGVEVEHDGSVTLEQLKQAIGVAGYDVVEADMNPRVLPTI